MFETQSTTLNPSGKTKLLSRTINLGIDLDLFIAGSSNDDSFLDYLSNKILDYSVEGITSVNTYKDFSSTLEHVNAVLKTWNHEDNESKLNMVIGILNKNELLLSNIGKSSCYLVKQNNVIEITDKKDIKKEFTFISNGTLEHNDIIAFSNKRLLNIFSESDFIDSFAKSTAKFTANLETILEEESFKKGISIVSLMYKADEEEPDHSSKISHLKQQALHLLDTQFCKKILAIFMMGRESLLKKGSLFKTGIFAGAIILLITLLYFSVGKTIDETVSTENVVAQKQELEMAKIAVNKANENIKNKDLFELNISKAKTIIASLKKEELFTADVEMLEEEIAQIQKSFNGISSFNTSEDKKIFTNNDSSSQLLVQLDNKTYVIGSNAISGPISTSEESKTYTFSALGDDNFIDATSITGSIILLTKEGKVVIFSKDGNFTFSDVIGQDTWQQADHIASYRSNIYLLSTKEKQIYKHSKSGNNFTKGSPYIKKTDQEAVGEIYDIAIDGGFYILRKTAENDLTFLKFFAGAQYRIDSLILNKLPDNYKNNPEAPSPIIKTRQDLNYVYMLLNNKIFVFEPNSQNYLSTKSLTYIGQIEGQSEVILDFYVKYDGDLLILNETGVYKMAFEISDGKLIVQ